MSSSEHDSPSDRDKPEAAPSAAEAPLKPQPRQRIEYLTAFRYVFTHPEWMKNLLLFAIFTLIPVLNTALIYGYLFETTEHLHRRLAGPYPLFQIRRFAIYMTRGIWCYLLGNILGVILLPVVQILTQGTTFGTMAVVGSRDQTAIIVAAVVVPMILTGIFLFLLALFVVFTPLLMRAGLTQDFALTFNFRWIGDFLRKMWIDTLLVNVFLMLSMLVLMPIGCAFFCYGFLVAMAFITLASAHLNWQLYELYLSRGGEPIPLKTEVQSYPTSPKSSASP
jgi:hypothetical protein